MVLANCADFCGCLAQRSAADLWLASTPEGRRYAGSGHASLAGAVEQVGLLQLRPSLRRRERGGFVLVEIRDAQLSAGLHSLSNQPAARSFESSARSTQCTGVGEWAGGGLREVIIRIAARHSTRPAPIPSTSHAAKNWLRIRCGRGRAHGTTPVEWQPTPTAMIVSKSPKRGGARVRRARRAG